MAKRAQGGDGAPEGDLVARAVTTIDSSTDQPRRVETWEAMKLPRLWVVLLAIVIGLVGGGGAAYGVMKQKPRYESLATLTIDQPYAIVAGQSEGIIAKLNNLRFKYVALLPTSVFTGPVAKELGLSEGEVAGSLRVGAPGPSLVLVIASRTHDPTTSKKIAQSLAERLVSYLQKEQEAALIPQRARIIFTIVVPAAEGLKVEPTKKRAAAVGAVTVVVLFGVVYTALQFLAARRRR